MFLNYMYCFMYFIFHFRIVMSFLLVAESRVDPENSDFKLLKEANVSLMTMKEINNAATYNITKIRSKRQSGGAGKFTEAAKMPQVKIMRLFLQLFKNFWDSAYVGGANPMHPNVPKVVVALYKQKIVEFFVPNVGEDPNKPMS